MFVQMDVSQALPPVSMAVNRLTFLLYPMDLTFCNSLWRMGLLSQGYWALHFLHSGGKAGVQGRGEGVQPPSDTAWISAFIINV